MPRQHRTAARQAEEIANQQQFPVIRVGAGRELGGLADERGMSIEAMPRRSHDRVARTIERERLGALQTARQHKSRSALLEPGKRFGRVRPLIEQCFLGHALRGDAERRQRQCRDTHQAAIHVRANISVAVSCIMQRHPLRRTAEQAN